VSQYDDDQKEISRIQFHDQFLTQEQRNYFIKQIKLKMEYEEQLELDGRGSGYYD